LAIRRADPSQCNSLDAVTCSLYNTARRSTTAAACSATPAPTDVGPFLQCITEGPLELE
jgi:hypothetical protein